MKNIFSFLPLLLLFLLFIAGCRDNPAVLKGVIDEIGYPECELVTPADGDTVGSYVVLQADASDNLGIVKVEFIVDDEVIAVDLFAPYEHGWATEALPQLSLHSVYAAAYDTDELRRGSELAFVTVDHDRGPPVPVDLESIFPQLHIPALLVSWSQSSAGDFNKYILRREITPGVTETSPVVIEITDQSMVSYLDESINIGQEYFYRMFVEDSDGYTSGSNELGGIVIGLPGVCNFGDLTIEQSGSNPVLTKYTIGSLGVLIRPTVIFKGGTYYMWMTSYYDGNYQIGHADSPDGENWTGCPENPVIPIGPVGAFDEDGAVYSMPIWDEDDGIYKQWYTGRKDGIGAIGYAESPDGIHWTKYANNPVMLPMELSWEGSEITARTVIKQAGEYIMWYGTPYVSTQTGLFKYNNGYATSSDGIHWSKHPTPVFTASPAPFVTQAASNGCIRIAPNGNYEMFYTGRDQEGVGLGFGRAVSADGIHWVTDPSNPLLVPSGGFEWNGKEIQHMWFIRTGNDYRFWYAGDQYATGSWTIGTATGVLVCN